MLVAVTTIASGERRPLRPLSQSNNTLRGLASKMLLRSDLPADTLLPDFTIDVILADVNQTSPQLKAWKWLKKYPSNTEGDSIAIIPEKYAVATLYYATNGSCWESVDESMLHLPPEVELSCASEADCSVTGDSRRPALMYEGDRVSGVNLKHGKTRVTSVQGPDQAG